MLRLLVIPNWLIILNFESSVFECVFYLKIIQNYNALQIFPLLTWQYFILVIKFFKPVASSKRFTKVRTIYYR
jgi:hypothetical protein